MVVVPGYDDVVDRAMCIENARNVVCVLVNYPHEVDLERLALFLRETKFLITWDEAVFTELLIPQPCESKRLDRLAVLIKESRMPSWDFADLLIQRIRNSGAEEAESVGPELFMWYFRDENRLSARKAAKLVVQSVLDRPDYPVPMMPRVSESTRRYFRTWGRKPELCEAKPLLDVVLAALKPNFVTEAVIEQGSSDSQAGNWTDFLGEFLMGLSAELARYKNVENAIPSNLGKILSSGPNTSTHRIGDVLLWEITAFAEVLKTKEDVIEFATGVLVRQPGERATVRRSLRRAKRTYAAFGGIVWTSKRLRDRR